MSGGTCRRWDVRAQIGAEVRQSNRRVRELATPRPTSPEVVLAPVSHEWCHRYEWAMTFVWGHTTFVWGHTHCIGGMKWDMSHMCIRRVACEWGAMRECYMRCETKPKPARLNLNTPFTRDMPDAHAWHVAFDIASHVSKKLVMWMPCQMRHVIDANATLRVFSTCKTPHVHAMSCQRNVVPTCVIEANDVCHLHAMCQLMSMTCVIEANDVYHRCLMHMRDMSRIS